MKYFIYILSSSVLAWLISFIFNFNTIGTYVLLVALSFVINNALPMKSTGYPFWRFGILIFVMLIIHGFINSSITEHVSQFFVPTLLWKFIFCLGFIFGLITSFGKNGRGLRSRSIHTFGFFGGLICLIISFVFFWWEGGVFYILARIPLIFIEEVLVGLIFYIITSNYERSING